MEKNPYVKRFYHNEAAIARKSFARMDDVATASSDQTVRMGACTPT
jgi:hypothetical protein